MLVDQGRVVPDGGGGWTATSDLTDVAVPATVQALLAARLDRLDPHLLDLLQVASVLGQTFYVDALAVVLDDAGDLSTRIEALIRTDLISPTVTDLPGHDAFTFTHLLTRDAAYHALPKARRAAVHHAIARWMATESAGDVIAGDLAAFHLERAATYLDELGDPDPAVAEEAATLLLLAADRLLAQFDLAGAAGVANRAAALVPEDSRIRAEIALVQSHAAAESGEIRTAFHRAADAERIADLLADEAIRARAQLAKCSLRVLSDPSLRVEDILFVTQQAIEVLRATDDELGLTMAFSLRAATYHILGKEWAAAAEAREGLEHARAGQLVSHVVLDLLGWLVMPFGSGNGSLPDMERTLHEIRRDYGHAPGIEQWLETQGIWVLAFHGRLEEATSAMRQRYLLALEKNSTFEALLWSAWGLGWCQQWAGDLVGAVESMSAANQLLEGVGETAGRSTVLAQLAGFLVRLGRDEEADVALATSRAVSQPNDLINQISFAGTECLLAAHRGDSRRSEQWFVEGLKIATKTEFVENEGELWLTRSLAQEALGDRSGALVAAREALARVTRKQFIPPILATRARIAELES